MSGKDWLRPTSGITLPADLELREARSSKRVWDKVRKFAESDPATQKALKAMQDAEAKSRAGRAALQSPEYLEAAE